MEKEYWDQSSVVKNYFGTAAALFSGDEGAIDRMMSLWAVGATLNVVGANDGDGWNRCKTYEGTAAIRKRYEAMMGPKTRLASANRDARLHVTFTVREVRVEGDVVSAIVTASMNTDERSPRELKVEQMNFTFTLENGKIQKAVENVDWSGAIASHRIAGPDGSLSVQDIGRLTLAAWAIA